MELYGSRALVELLSGGFRVRSKTSIECRVGDGDVQRWRAILEAFTMLPMACCRAQRLQNLFLWLPRRLGVIGTLGPELKWVGS